MVFLDQPSVWSYNHCWDRILTETSGSTRKQKAVQREIERGRLYRSHILHSCNRMFTPRIAIRRDHGPMAECQGPWSHSGHRRVATHLVLHPTSTWGKSHCPSSNFFPAHSIFRILIFLLSWRVGCHSEFLPSAVLSSCQRLKCF